MFFYVGKQFESAVIGGRLIGVQCDKCDCQYYYRLTRIGTGAAEAPYLIGAGSAAHRAQQQSEKELQKRLAIEAELVPCPKCGWINDELVHGYRLGRYRYCNQLALAAGVVGTASSLICGGVISRNPIDRELARNVLIGGPALFLLFASVLILVRSWLRQRIQPNRNFPLLPELPPGSPPALLLDESSGQLIIARPGALNDWLDFQLGRHNLPGLCCHCLQPPDPQHAYKVRMNESLMFEIPRCAACAQKSNRKSWRIWFVTVTLGLVGGVPILALMRLQSFDFWLIFGASFLILCAVASIFALQRTPGKVIDHSRGIVRLKFSNTEYRRLAAQQIIGCEPM